jgi:dTDP-4-dehydrorhamnose reductase
MRNDDLKRIVIVGGGGMLGHRLVREFCNGPSYEVHATVRTSVAAPFRHRAATWHEGIELACDTTRLQHILREVQPHVVINAAGIIKQREAAADADLSMFINGALPHVLGVAATELGARLLHVSTDCVYSGALPAGAYTEADLPDAVDVYGRSKAVGEVAWGGHLTVRTSIIGFELAKHLGFMGWLFGNPEGATVQGYERAIYSGLPTPTLARTIRRIVEERPRLAGLYHVASEPIPKLELVRRLNGAFRLGLTVVPDSRVSCNRALDDSRFRHETGWARPGWDELVQDLLADYTALPYGQAGYRSGLLPTNRQELAT